jgi:hypothetical protein
MDLPAGVPVHETHMPEIRLKNSEIGAKLSLSTSALDVALSGFYTWDDMPTLHFEPDGIHPRHHRLAIAGLDMSVPVWLLVIRAEAAYTHGRYFTTRSGTLEEKSSITGLVGADISPGNDWNISTQFYNRYIVDYDTIMTDPEHDLYATLRVGKELLRNTLSLSAMAFYGFENREVYCRASATYALTDALKIGAGVDLFEGDEGGMFGSYKENSAGFVECRYGF